MNSEIKVVTKQDWSAALRSGEFKQCRDSYSRNEGTSEETNCCLGVLNRLVYGADAGWKPPTRAAADALEAMGLDAEVTIFIQMNDEQMLSFEQIADYIDTLP